MKTTSTLSILVAFLLLISSYRISAAVCNGDVVLSSQAEVNAFTCSEVSGNLTISGDDITNLDALATLQRVGGHLSIEVNVNLDNLDGLSALTWIEGILYIRYDTILQNLNGLSALKHAGALYILENHNLRNLDGFSSLTEVNDLISIQYNGGLVGIDGLSSLRSVNGELRIANNPELKSINGLVNLNAVGGLAIMNNPKLVNVKGLNSVVKVADNLGNPGYFTIEGNDALINLQGFSALESTNYFNIVNNRQLSDLDDFVSLRAVSGIYITDNPKLSKINAFANIDSIAGELRIQNNDKLINLNAFSSLQRVGSISIYENQSLASIDGLSNIQQVGAGLGSSIWISNNDALTHIDGFSSVNKIGGPVAIKYNPSLESVDGFSSVTQFNGHAEISNNDVLTSISGFNKLTQISESGFGVGIIVNQNPRLAAFNGFSALKIIYGSTTAFLEIGDNPLLTNFDGLSNLTTISAGIRGINVAIYRNPSLKNVNGFSSLSTINVGSGGSLYINDNAGLENIDGLSALKGSVYGPFLYITVTQNASLTKCDGLYPYFVSLGAEEVLRRANSDVIRIADNGAGCTIEDIMSSGPISISYFTIIDERTGNVVNSFYNDSVTLDLAHPDFHYWAIRANTTPAEVGSVEFIFDKIHAYLDNEPPFAVQLPLHTPGIYTLSADVYSQDTKGGVKGIGKSAIIKIINSAAVVSFDVVDTSGNFLMQLSEGGKINIKDPAFKSFSIRANTNPDAVSSVKFWLNNQFYRVEYVAPYAFNGDVNGVYNSWNVNPWNYTIRAIPYIKIGTTEYAGKPLEVHFQVLSENMVASIFNFELVDNAGRILRELKDGDDIDVNDPLFHEMTVIANVLGEAGSVTFHLNNQFYRTENVWPYTLTGNNNDDFTPWVPSVGHYTLSATPYANDFGTGDVGKSLTIQIDVVNGVGNTMLSGFEATSGTPLNLSVYPVPVDNALFLIIRDGEIRNASVTIFNNQGRSVYNGTYSEAESINTSGLNPGVYVLRIFNNGHQTTTRFIKE